MGLTSLPPSCPILGASTSWSPKDLFRLVWGLLLDASAALIFRVDVKLTFLSSIYNFYQFQWHHTLFIVAAWFPKCHNNLNQCFSTVLRPRPR